MVFPLLGRLEASVGGAIASVVRAPHNCMVLFLGDLAWLLGLPHPFSLAGSYFTSQLSHYLHFRVPGLLSSKSQLVQGTGDWPLGSGAITPWGCGLGRPPL